MAWTDERIALLKKMWEEGKTASQIAEELGGVSRNAVIGKAHRLDLQSRPSPVRGSDDGKGGSTPRKPAPPRAKAPRAEAVAPKAARPASVVASEALPEERSEPRAAPAPAVSAVPKPVAGSGTISDPGTGAQMRSVGPGGFLRQGPGDQQAPIPPAPPRRLVPAKPSPEIAGKTSLLDLNDKVCKWPIGHPGEPDFHFCGDKINPGFPYCVAHCGLAYQAQMPRRDRRPPPPLPYGAPRVR